MAACLTPEQVESYREPLLRMVLALGYSDANAQDAVQEALIGLFPYINRAVDNPDALARQILKRKLAAIWKEEIQYLPIGLDGEMVRIDAFIHDGPIHLSARTYDACRHLVKESDCTPREGQCFLMRIEGHGATAIARKLSLTRQQVRHALRVAAEKLTQQNEQNPLFAPLFVQFSHVHLKHSVTSITYMMRLHLHRNGKNM